MRDSSHWKKTLVKQLLKAASFLTSEEASQICDVELGIILVKEIYPEEPISDVVPIVLSGYATELHSDQDLSIEKLEMLAVGRYLLRFYQGTRRWPAALNWYTFEVKESLKLFDLGLVGRFTHVRNTSLLPERSHLYLKALQSPPPHVVQVNETEPDVTYYFCNESSWDPASDHWHSVQFPRRLLDRIPKAEDRELRSKLKREDLRVSWSELLETADWMDRGEPGESRHWRRRMERNRLKFLSIEQESSITLTGVFHLVGMLGSGKSTLMDVLAVWAAGRGLRVTLVVGDVVAAVRRATMFRNLGIPSVPLLGARNRKKRMETIQRVVAANSDKWTFLPEDEMLTWMSPVCLLDGLTKQSGGSVNFGEEPCYSLREKRDFSSPRYVCPLMPKCPVHRASNELNDSAIWVATIQSLLYTRAPLQATHKNIRYLELVYRESDLVVVDEADWVQVHLDEAFVPNDSLVGAKGNGWLDQLGRKSVPLPGITRGEYFSSEGHLWMEAQRTAQQAVDVIVHLTERYPTIKNRISEHSFFTGFSLFKQVTTDIEDRLKQAVPTDTKKYEAESLFEITSKEIYDFLESPLEGEEALPEIARSAMLTFTSPRVRELSIRWLMDKTDQWLSELHVPDRCTVELREEISGLWLALLTAIATAILDDRLKTIVDRWEAAERIFRLEAGSEWFFRRPPRDYGPLIPESPMGNLFGFRYVLAQDKKGGDLQFFRCSGIGRWLLLHIHDFLERLDGVAGPSVLLLSGTSWAPGSTSYHVHVQPKAVLEVPLEELEGISRSTCRFHCTYTDDEQPIRISGVSGNERSTRLRGALKYLAGNSGPGRASRLQSELDCLPHGRKRLLLVVGSYDEANIAYQYMSRLSGWEGRVLPLVRDQDADSLGSDDHIPRGLIDRLMNRGEDVLIAPLKAIERGHNILNEDGVAAIGSVFFLIRPCQSPMT